jgi:hypothetical protein
MNSETAVVVSKSNVKDEQAVSRRKRKLCERTDSMGTEDENTRAKRQRTEEIYFCTENDNLSTEQTVMVLNGQWHLIQTVPSIIEIDGETIEDLEVQMFCVSRSKISGREIITENVNGAYIQCSERAECMDSYMNFSESTPLTNHKDTMYKDINNTGFENTCDENMSLVTSFKVGSMVRADEVKYDCNNKGQEDSEITCPGMC